jgi:hypothetical protein
MWNIAEKVFGEASTNVDSSPSSFPTPISPIGDKVREFVSGIIQEIPTNSRKTWEKKMEEFLKELESGNPEKVQHPQQPHQVQQPPKNPMEVTTGSILPRDENITVELMDDGELLEIGTQEEDGKNEKKILKGEKYEMLKKRLEQSVISNVSLSLSEAVPMINICKKMKVADCYTHVKTLEKHMKATNVRVVRIAVELGNVLKVLKMHCKKKRLTLVTELSRMHVSYSMSYITFLISLHELCVAYPRLTSTSLSLHSIRNQFPSVKQILSENETLWKQAVLL